MEGRDVLELILRLDINSYRASRRQRNKTPYNEYPEGAVLELSDEDEDEVRLYDAISALPSEPGKVKKEPMSVSELDEKMEKRMKEELDTRLWEANEEHARKMAAIQAEMEQARLESARRHADLMSQNQQFLAQSQQFMHEHDAELAAGETPGGVCSSRARHVRAPRSRAASF
jgi:cell division septum initiation protein DivIVA